jgi:GLPGLI family protein
MKKSLFFFFFYSQFILAQNNRVTYDFHIVSDETVIKNEYFGSQFKKIAEGAKYLSFELCYNDSIAVFENKEIMDTENNEISSAVSYSGISKNIYTYKDFNYSNNDDFGLPENKYIIKKPVLNNWVLGDETKVIDGYSCYKATTELVTENKYLKEIFRFPVIAWYCPQIPTSFGPAGYGKLPGLIMELQENLKVFTIKKIEFNVEKKIIVLPEKGILILQNDFDEILDKSMRKSLNN